MRTVKNADNQPVMLCSVTSVFRVVQVFYTLERMINLKDKLRTKTRTWKRHRYYIISSHCSENEQWLLLYVTWRRRIHFRAGCLSCFFTSTLTVQLFISLNWAALDEEMLSKLLIVLYFAFGTSFVGKFPAVFRNSKAYWTCLSVAQSSIVCVAGQCLEGYANITRAFHVK